MAKGKGEAAEHIVIEGIVTEATSAYLVGTSPLIYNAMSAKTIQSLLMPGRKKNDAEKAATLKHDPMQEYRESVYKTRRDDEPTRLNFPTASVKKAMASAALDIPGAHKSQIGRLVWISGDRAPLYGVPQIFCAIARQQDVARTPDVRTRAIVPQWCLPVENITFARPNLTRKAVINLLAAAGLLNGLGDWRQQKGSGSYGQFRLAAEDDPEVRLLMETAGRVAQDEALANPQAYDEETERLLAWFHEEVERRGQESQLVPMKGGKKKAA